MNSVNIKLIEFPDFFGITENDQSEYKLRTLLINNKAPVVDELIKFEKNDLKKLLKNLKEQLNSKEILKNPNKVRQGKNGKQKNIIEVKSNRGHLRLFGFFWKNEFIICTNIYWKTTDKQNKQNAAFNKAVNIMELFLINN